MFRLVPCNPPERLAIWNITKVRNGSWGEVFDLRIDLPESYSLFRLDVNRYLFAHFQLHTRDLLFSKMKFLCSDWKGIYFPLDNCLSKSKCCFYYVAHLVTSVAHLCHALAMKCECYFLTEITIFFTIKVCIIYKVLVILAPGCNRDNQGEK